MFDVAKFEPEDFVLAVVLSYLHSRGDKPGKLADKDDINEVTKFYEKNPNQWLRFLLWVIEMKEVALCFTDNAGAAIDGTGNSVSDKLKKAFKTKNISMSAAGAIFENLLADTATLKVIYDADFMKGFYEKIIKDKKSKTSDEKKIFKQFFSSFDFPSEKDMIANINNIFVGIVFDKIIAGEDDSYYGTKTDGTAITLAEWFGSTASATVAGTVKEASGGGFKNQSGGAYELLVSLLRETLALPELSNPSKQFKLRSYCGLAMPWNDKRYSEYMSAFAPALRTSISSSDKLFKLVWDGSNLVLKDMNDNVIKDTLVSLGKNLDPANAKKLGLNVTDDGGVATMAAECSQGNGKQECIVKLNTVITAETDIIDEDKFEHANPFLIVDLLEKLNWAQYMNRGSDGRVVRKYVETWDEYDKTRVKNGDSTHQKLTNQYAKLYLERCAKYINKHYSNVINDATFIENEERKKSTKERNSGLSYPIAVESHMNYSPYLRNINAVGLAPLIQARNFNFARLSAMPGGSQYVMPIGYDIFNNTEQTGSGHTDVYFGTLYSFYTTTISRLKNALKMANKQLDSSSDNKINAAMQKFHDDTVKLNSDIEIMRKYNQINVHTKDSKHNVNLDDMKRFTDRFDNSVNELNKSEIKISKIITQLQESFIKTFKNTIENAETAV